MTTVRGTESNTSVELDPVDIIIGEAIIKSSDLSPDQWTRVIDHAVSLMSLTQLRGCKKVSELLEGGRTYQFGGPEPAAVIRSDAEFVNVQKGKAYLKCIDMTDGLFRRGEKHWPTTKRINPTYGYEESVYVPVTEKLLILGRDGRFSLLRTTWEIVIWWGEEGYGDEPLGIWLEATRVECSDASILELVTEDITLAPSILYHLRLAQMETAQEVAAQARPVQVRSDKLKAMLDALGMVT